MKEGGKDIRVSSKISEKEEKQISKEIKERQAYLEPLRKPIQDLELEKKKLEDEKKKLDNQIQEVKDKISEYKTSENPADIDYVFEQEEKKEKLNREFIEKLDEIKNIEAQITEKKKEVKRKIEMGGLKEVGKDVAVEDMLEGLPIEEKRVEEAKNKFKTFEKELEEMESKLKEKEIELLEKKDELSELKSRLFMAESSDKPDSEELKKLEKEETEKVGFVSNLKKEIKELKEKIPEKEKRLEKLTNNYLDMFNELQKLKQQ